MLLFLTGCKTTALYSDLVPGLWEQRQHTLNASQPCQDAPQLLRCAEKMADKLLDQAVAAGLSTSRAEVLKRWGHPGVCLVERWEPCRLGSICAEASKPELRCTPRAGCTILNSSWVSRTDEQGRPYEYGGTLEGELRVSLANMLGLPTDPRHQTAWDTALPTGVRCLDQ